MSRNPRMLTTLAAALMASAGVLAAEPATVPPDAPKATATDPNADAGSKSTDAKAAAKKASPDCEDTTSSRIRRNKAGQCVKSASPTRSYSREEIERTGQMDVGDALRRLDPRFH